MLCRALLCIVPLTFVPLTFGPTVCASIGAVANAERSAAPSAIPSTPSSGSRGDRSNLDHDGRPADAPARRRAPSGTQAAADEGHLWLALPPAGGAADAPSQNGASGAGSTVTQLLHHHPGMSAGTRIAGRFEHAPIVMTARGSRVWIALPNTPVGAPTERVDGRGQINGAGPSDPGVTIWTLRAVENPGLRTYFNDPADRFDLLPALPPGVVLEAMAATDSALLVAVRGVSERTGLSGIEVDGSPDLERRVLRQAADGWSALPALPASAHGAGEVQLAMAGPDRNVLVLALDDGERTRFWFLGPVADRAAPWREVGDLHGSIQSLLSIDGRAVAIMERPDGAWQVFWLRDAGALAGPEIEPRPESAALVADAGGAVAIELDEAAQPALRPLDLRQGTWGESLATSATRSVRQRFAHIQLLGLLVGAAVLTLLLIHPERIPATLPLPAGFSLPEFAPRCGALIIDFMIAAAITWGITRVSLVDLLLLPIWTSPIEQAAGPLLALFLTAMIAGISEAATGASLGKRAVGLVVSMPDGTRPGAARALLRALLKFIVLCLPLLAIFHVLNPVRRGLPELLSGTWILGREEAPPTDEE